MDTNYDFITFILKYLYLKKACISQFSLAELKGCVKWFIYFLIYFS